MANYLITHYKGKYKLMVPYNLETNDFSRKLDGNYEDIDCYIDCKNNIKVSYYGNRGILEAYIPSLGRGRNIIKSIYSDFVQDIKNSPYCSIVERNFTDNNMQQIKSYDYESLYKDNDLNKIISDIRETDEEIIFKFHAKYMEQFEKYLNPKTSAASRSPFSVKNLPRSNYTIPDADLNAYLEITSAIPKGELLKLSHITKDFINNVLAKNKLYKSVNIKEDMRKKMISGKNYIHAMGYWNEYLEYLKKELNKICQS